ncbi:MAG: universal stress protein [Hyphomicrobiales bacterium]
MKVLVGVDDSPFSEAAIEYAKRAAWPQGTEFLVLSSSPPIWVGPGEAVAVGPIAQLNQEQQDYHRSIAEKASKSLTGSGLVAKAMTGLGDPRSAIVDAATRERVDLVIVGSHGRSGFKKLLLGSVASHVVAHAPCSVLVVKQPA